MEGLTTSRNALAANDWAREFMKRIGSLLLACAAALLVASCDRTTTDYTRGRSDRCEVHGTKMTRASVPIEYGLVRLNEWGKQLQTASTNSFPHAQESVLAGCIVENATQAVIYACPTCQEARKKWEAEHPKSPRP
jgi:hypothetical protein